MDLSTAEKALHALESAYRNNDLELAAHCRNFEHEAKLVLHHLERRAGTGLATPEAVTQLAQTLEAKWKQAGPPDFAGVTSKVTCIEHYAEYFYVVTEERCGADGRHSSQRTFMSQSGGPWAVLCPVAIYQAPRQEKKPWWAVWQ